jgi:hypothetical protein
MAKINYRLPRPPNAFVGVDKRFPLVKISYPLPRPPNAFVGVNKWFSPLT